MKKISAFILFVLCSLTSFANEYTDTLTVTVNGESSTQQTTISVTKGEDGKYTLSLNNFCLEVVEPDSSVTRLGVGNIVLADREGTTVDGITSITYNDDLQITIGDDPAIEFWMGPLLGAVPIAMEARFNDTKLYCEIHIKLMDLLGQLIYVYFGAEPQPSAGIRPFTTFTSASQSVFDLQGRKVTEPTKGIYIINGKKVIR